MVGYSEIKQSDRAKIKIFSDKGQPKHYLKTWLLKDGTSVTVRPVKISDAVALVRFYRSLSAQSILMRWLSPLPIEQVLENERKTLLRALKNEDTLMLVAEYRPRGLVKPQIIGVATLAKIPEHRCGDVALLVADRFQHQGLGVELMQCLILTGRHQKLSCLIGDIHPENSAMRRLCQKLGFRVYYSIDEQLTKFELAL